jgi:hypothetical protein
VLQPKHGPGPIRFREPGRLAEAAAQFPGADRRPYVPVIAAEPKSHFPISHCPNPAKTPLAQFGTIGTLLCQITPAFCQVFASFFRPCSLFGRDSCKFVRLLAGFCELAAAQSAAFEAADFPRIS